jgi:hypothetical protein
LPNSDAAVFTLSVGSLDSAASQWLSDVDSQQDLQLVVHSQPSVQP